MISICVNCCIDLGVVPVFQNNFNEPPLKFNCYCCNKMFNTSVMVLTGFLDKIENRSKIICHVRNRKIDSINALEN